MKPLVIYHANYADGFGAAFAAWLKFGDEAEYLPMDYGAKDWDHTTCYGRDVYILDFSFPRDVMDALFRHAKRVVWLDHHRSSREIAIVLCEYDVQEMEGYSRLDHEELTWKLVHDNNKSGAMLAWEYFHPDTKVPMLIRHQA